ncbi:fasciclin-like arabinogalactan protein 14 [Hordeum vulgare]|uniref:Predicted protein n=1 Tax=Hordeum vulgare subsp. vulgare TaxID=112509 RepID=F2EHB8_HORVV|nr:fasciclin-like arabinogalactan protein 14 [Hordeum vulgare subsp. vulgare]KAE8819576.1 fasciclin-like arabinogalactan protein 14 [Hordeum vulgare]KAI5012863.1 hypothetical protein ZWY2020_025129 [Hordeum vulgare]BAK06740.1 predicted protein [Hordeum vulgare subsp. vulgare]
MACLRAAIAALLLVTLASSAAAAKTKFNITEVLDESPEFSTFNSLLSKTNLVEEINKRQTITVLVVDNSAASAITSLPTDTQKKVLAVQVILDYYDPMKLEGIEKRTALLTTLFQTTGAATDRAGLVNYTHSADDQMAFGSAEPGAPLSSQLVKVVACRPYNLSVMQVSAAIIPPSISSSDKGSSGPPGKAHGSSSNASVPTITDAETLQSFDEASAADDDGLSPSGGGPTTADAAASSPPVHSADAAAGAHTSVGNTVVVRTRVGLIGLVMLMI